MNLRNLKTNVHAGKSVTGAWQPIGMLESVCVGGAKVKFDIAALKWQISWWLEMVSTAFCIMLDFIDNLLILNGMSLGNCVVIWYFMMLEMYWPKKILCFVWL